MKLNAAKTEKVIISTLLTLTSVIFLYTAGFGTFSSMTQRALLLALLSPMVFIGFKKSAENKGKHLLNILLALIIMAVNFYVIVVWPDRTLKTNAIPLTDIIVGSLLVILILEATRRINGWSLTIITASFLVYALLGPYFPSFLAHRGETWSRLTNFLFMSTDGIFGIPLDIVSTYIIVFVIFGAFLEAFGGGQWFTEIAYSLTGRFRGGPAKTAIIGSACMGGITGSPPASVATVGTFTIPLMKKVGYKPIEAGAIEAVASTGGMFTPPVMGAGAFIMAQYLNLPYWQVCIAAIVPAFLYYMALILVADSRAAKYNLVGLPKEKLPSFWKAMRDRGHLGIPIVFLIVTIAGGWSPGRAAFWSILLMIVVSSLSKLTRPSLAKILKVLESGAEQVTPILITCAAAGIIVGVFLITGLGAKLTYALIAFHQGSLVWAAIWSMIIANILGLPLTATAVYIISITILVPILTQAGANPIAAHLFIWIYASIGAITPPVAIAAYCASGIAQSNPDRTGWLAFRFGIPAFIIPFMFIFNPALILQGSPIDIILAVGAGIIGVMCLVAMMEGFMIIHWNVYSRVIMGVSTILLLYPNKDLNLVGLFSIVIALLVNQFFSSNRNYFKNNTEKMKGIKK